MLWGSGAGLLLVSSSLWCATTLSKTRHSVLGGPCQQACCPAIDANVANCCSLAVGLRQRCQWSHGRDSDRRFVSRHGRLVAYEVRLYARAQSRTRGRRARSRQHRMANTHEPVNTGTHHRKAHARVHGSSGARSSWYALFTASTSKSPDLRIRQATTRPPGQAQVVIVPGERQPLCGTAKLRQSWHSFGPAAHASDDTRWTAYCWR